MVPKTDYIMCVSPDKKKCGAIPVTTGSQRHCSFRWLLTSGGWRSGRKSPYKAMRPGTRTDGIKSYGYRQRPRCHSIRRCRLSVFSIAHRRVAVNGCQCLHRHLLTAYRRQDCKTAPPLTAFAEEKQKNGEYTHELVYSPFVVI